MRQKLTIVMVTPTKTPTSDIATGISKSHHQKTSHHSNATEDDEEPSSRRSKGRRSKRQCKSLSQSDLSQHVK